MSFKCAASLASPSLSSLHHLLHRYCPSLLQLAFRAFTLSRPELLLAPSHSFLAPVRFYDLCNTRNPRINTPSLTNNFNMRCSSAVVLSTLAIGGATAAHLNHRHASFHERRQA